MATKTEVKNFISYIAPLVVKVCNRKSRKVLPSVCIAQACCESAYGTSSKMSKANAVLGVKVGKNKVRYGTAWKGAAYSTKTKECYDGKTLTDITALFRAYDSVEDSIEDYYDLLGNSSRYSSCIGILDYKECIEAIKKSGYCTSLTYVNTIINIIQKNNLTKYDVCMTGGTATNPSSNPYSAPLSTVTFGNTGTKVKWLQWELVQSGYNISIDGDFGNNTLKALKDFQEAHKIEVDGKCGPITKRELLAETKALVVKPDYTTPVEKIYKVGDIVTINTYFSNSGKNARKVSNVKTGKIARIIHSAEYPYSISVNNSIIGWTNKQYIVTDTKVKDSKSETQNNSNNISSTINTPITHKVVKGETLGTIAKKYNVSVDSIVELNKSTHKTITKNFIRTGWVLKIK